MADKKYELQATLGLNKKIKKGSTKKIMYNPKKPEEAFFKKDYGFLVGLLVILGFIALVTRGIFS